MIKVNGVLSVNKMEVFFIFSLALLWDAIG